MMMRGFRGLESCAIVSALAVVPACAGSSASSTSTHADSAGIDIATYAGADVSLDWTFETRRVLGGEEAGDESFYEVHAGYVDADADGNLYVLDGDAHRILVFDSTGGFVRAMGREGGGPGEFRLALSFSVTPGGVVSLFDIGKRAISRFGPDGSPLDQVAAPSDYFGGSLHLADNVLTLPRQNRSDDGGAVDYLSRMTSTDTVRLGSIAHQPGKAIQLESCGMGFSSMPPLFAPTLRWYVRGDRTAVVTTANYEVHLFDGDSLATVIRRSLQPTTATEEAALRQVGPAMEVRTEGGVRRCESREVVEQRGFLPVIPAIAQVAIDPAGRIWIERGHVRDEPAPIDIFDGRGDYIGTLPASTHFPVAFLSDTRIASITKDELDVTRLVIHDVRPGGLEQE